MTPRARWAGLLTVVPLGCVSTTGIVRTRAATDFDCPESEVTVEDVAGTTYRATGCGRTATFTCGGPRENTCVHDDAPTAAPAPAASSVPGSAAALGPSTKPAPPGAVGFSFGQSAEEAGQVCTEAGHEWRDEPKARACSGTPIKLEVQATTRLGFCGEKVCRIELHARPAPDRWIAALGALRSKLEERYGPASDSRVDFPNDCMQDMQRCAAEGRAITDVSWTWSDGHAITLRIAKGAEPEIVVAYRSPAATSRASGL